MVELRSLDLSYPLVLVRARARARCDARCWHSLVRAIVVVVAVHHTFIIIVVIWLFPFPTQGQWFGNSTHHKIDGKYVNVPRKLRTKKVADWLDWY